ncbi:MAG: DUF4332 domain-containing protein [Myxococcota bacterium]
MANKKIEDRGHRPGARAKFEAAGVKDTDGLLDKRAAQRAGRKALSEATGLSESRILTFVNMADLFRIKGVAGEFAELLMCAGVDTVRSSRRKHAANLATKLAEVNAEKKLTGPEQSPTGSSRRASCRADRARRTAPRGASGYSTGPSDPKRVGRPFLVGGPRIRSSRREPDRSLQSEAATLPIETPEPIRRPPWPPPPNCPSTSSSSLTPRSSSGAATPRRLAPPPTRVADPLLREPPPALLGHHEARRHHDDQQAAQSSSERPRLFLHPRRGGPRVRCDRRLRAAQDLIEMDSPLHIAPTLKLISSRFTPAALKKIHSRSTASPRKSTTCSSRRKARSTSSRRSQHPCPSP